MKSKTVVCVSAIAAAMATFSACSKNTPAPADGSAAAAPDASPLSPAEQNAENYYVQGVAGGVMTNTVTLQAEVVSVDQVKRAAVLRGPDGNEVTVRVGEHAVNFYQVMPGDRVNVAMAQELVVYVADGTQDVSDGTAAMAAGAQKGDAPAGAVVTSSKVTGKIIAMDTTARTATLSFSNGTEKTFNVRPDVDMTKYSVGQEVVFLLTEMLALEVKKL